MTGTQGGDEAYDPFPEFKYTGPQRAHYPLVPLPDVPPTIARPKYNWLGEYLTEAFPFRIPSYAGADLDGMRRACRLAREVLDLLAAEIKVGTTLTELDQRCFALAVERDCYPSPLGYHGFPQSVCTSVNEIVCHGIPDQYALQEGDVLNLDVTLYHHGYHGDVNMTYVLPPVREEKARLLRTTRECLDRAISLCGPGMPYAAIGEVIDPYAQKNGCTVVRSYTGHGIGRDQFHGPPRIYHHYPNHSRGVMQPGHIFAIEPMLVLGQQGKVVTWPDGWTVASASGQVSAAFEETLLITDKGVEVLTAQGGSEVYDTTARRKVH